MLTGPSAVKLLDLETGKLVTTWAGASVFAASADGALVALGSIRPASGGRADRRARVGPRRSTSSRAAPSIRTRIPDVRLPPRRSRPTARASSSASGCYDAGQQDGDEHREPLRREAGHARRARRPRTQPRAPAHHDRRRGARPLGRWRALRRRRRVRPPPLASLTAASARSVAEPDLRLTGVDATLEEGARREPDELAEVGDEVRLVVIARVSRRCAPSPSTSPPSAPARCRRTVRAKSFGRDADALGEGTAEMPRSDAELLRHALHPNLACFEQANPRGARAVPMPISKRLARTKARWRWTLGRGAPAGCAPPSSASQRLAARAAPDVFQRDDPIRQRVRGHAEERRRPAGLELAG